jgi:hypothetical protein
VGVQGEIKARNNRAEILVYHNWQHSTAKVQQGRPSIVIDCVQDDLQTLVKSSPINVMPTVAVTQKQKLENARR